MFCFSEPLNLPIIKVCLERFLSEETMQVIEDLTKIINVKDLKQSATAAQKLREDIISWEQVGNSESANLLYAQVKEEQIKLIENLQFAISVMQNQVLEHADNTKSTFNYKLQQVMSVAEQLLSDITHVKTIEVMESKDQEIEEQKPIESVHAEEKLVDLQETVVKEILPVPESSALNETELKDVLQKPEQVLENQLSVLTQTGELRLSNKTV